MEVGLRRLLRGGDGGRVKKNKKGNSGCGDNDTYTLILVVTVKLF
jgi:hypothetical protein